MHKDKEDSQQLDENDGREAETTSKITSMIFFTPFLT